MAKRRAYSDNNYDQSYLENLLSEPPVDLAWTARYSADGVSYNRAAYNLPVNMTIPAKAVDSLWYIADPNVLAPAEQYGEFATTGGKWGASPTFGTSGGTVTWSIAGAGLTNQTGQTFFTGSTVAMSSFLPADFVTQITNAFAQWSAVANIDFVQVADGGGNFGIGTAGNIRIGGGFIDGFNSNGSVVGRGFFPPSGTANASASNGDIIVDSGDHWDDALLFAVVLHEIGHTLGLDHSPQNNPVAVMNPTVHLGLPLQPDDIAGIQAVYGPRPTAPVDFVAERDFNADGTSDILWKSDSNGLAIWDISAGHVTAGHDLPALPAGWTVAATGDFNADHTADLLIHNDATGGTAIWPIANGAVFSGTDLPTLGTAWHVLAAADFNHDGTADILWGDNAGKLMTWDISAGHFLAGHDLPTLPSGWNVSDTGDFNADGTYDLLLHNNGTGGNAIWELADSGHLLAGLDLPAFPAGWQSAGAADFNADGTTDILMGNGSGGLAIWTIINGHVSTARDLPLLPAGWAFAGTGDFNRDGRSDLLLRNEATGGNAVWELGTGGLLAGVDLPILQAPWHPDLV
jgi:hypothetical protein